MTEVTTLRQIDAAHRAAEVAEQYKLMQQYADAERREEETQAEVRNELRDPSPECLEFLGDSFAHCYEQLALEVMRAGMAQTDLRRLHHIGNAMAMLRDQVERYVRSQDK